MSRSALNGFQNIAGRFLNIYGVHARACMYYLLNSLNALYFCRRNIKLSSILDALSEIEYLAAESTMFVTDKI